MPSYHYWAAQTVPTSNFSRGKKLSLVRLLTVLNLRKSRICGFDFERRIFSLYFALIDATLRSFCYGLDKSSFKFRWFYCGHWAVKKTKKKIIYYFCAYSQKQFTLNNNNKGSTTFSFFFFYNYEARLYSLWLRHS